MSRIFIILFLGLLISAFVSAQIPNNGFETWINMGSYENPEGWSTMNNSTLMFGVFTANKGVPGNPGSAYLALTTAQVGDSVVNGIACSGILDTITKQPKSGFPYTARPQRFTGVWQHMASSQGSIAVTLTKWNTLTSARDMVGTANMTLSGMAMSWENFSINFTYVNSNTPDSCIIFLKASGYSPFPDDYLWVDNLSFSKSTNEVDFNADNVKFVSVYPNPVHDEFEIVFSDFTNQGRKIVVLNVLGKVVFESEIIQNYSKVNTSEFLTGIYFYDIYDKNNILLSKGKLLVHH